MAKLFVVLFILLSQAAFLIAAADEDLFTLASAEHASVAKFKSALDGLPPGEINKIRDGDGRTLLHWAVAASQQVRTSELLFAGADVNIKDNRGRTPLFECIEAHDSDWKGEADIMTLEMLAYRGADVNARERRLDAARACSGKRRHAQSGISDLAWCGAEPGGRRAG